jgi:hypothetical protein
VCLYFVPPHRIKPVGEHHASPLPFTHTCYQHSTAHKKQHTPQFLWQYIWQYTVPHALAVVPHCPFCMMPIECHMA